MRSYPKSVSMGKQYNKKRKEKHMKKSQIITTMLMAGMLLAGCSNKPGNTSNTEILQPRIQERRQQRQLQVWNIKIH